MPAATPVTTPVAFTVAIVGSLVAHAPPAVASVNALVAPVQTGALPVMAAAPFMVTTKVGAVPQPFEYWIVAVPGATAVTVVVDAPVVTVATPVFRLVHVPVGSVSDNVVVFPAHIIDVPVIAAGGKLTVTVVVAELEHAPFVDVAVITLTVVAGVVVG